MIKQTLSLTDLKHPIDNPDQLALGEAIKDIDTLPVVVTETVTCERPKKQRPEDSVTDQGLRFNDDVPVEVILMKAPEMEGEDADQFEVVDYRSTYRLAQRPSSYVILNYLEDDIRKQGLEGDKKHDYRQLKARPLVDQFFTWNKEQLRRLDPVPNNPLSKALGYVQKREVELWVHLDDPSVDIDTNHLERTLRCIPMDRKSWMFAWTLEGADNVAVFRTLIASCCLAGIDLHKYMVDVLQCISLNPARNIQDLIPRIWKEKFGANPLKSDLD